ncbi:hypothetical protein JTE90_019548 [Oedothorax gibbosus]|uniref:Uncharacterized protein n=1 Tax=Oedothorax gibbosus TaxID=931172 RepID=A0AAV6U8T2_9ARAC|nr:hypothetical protein JTE90_019548 [Oedothorax gibbosus]
MARRIAGLSGHTADKKGEEKDRPLGLPWIVRLDHQELPGPGICGDSMGGVATFVEFKSDPCQTSFHANAPPTRSPGNP